ncbi:MAG: methylated-DNA--[protein]-cysteine S-methyltransferase [Deltaproteobacteria bacterium]|nr:methylated-DNA--[protein]-cysteine S-methyltransferase [Deltaproteobacteria bacterium]MBI3387889.1 methylated-DNA--[protein]-cysteine S-methyltransferase [Deltaproteobacteria bacterium]
MVERQTFLIDTMKTPLGTAILIVDEHGALRMHMWEDPEETWRKRFHDYHGDSALVARRDPFGHVATLERYFDGEITALESISVAFVGTPFQTKVWNALRTIAGGTTLSYGALAKRIGDPKAVRAVGLANGRNPIGVVVPCHRVIGSNGSLTGYGGGLPRKRWLLEHEARHSTFRLEVSA